MPGKGGSGGAAGPAVVARRALLAFGVLFVVLFAIVAIAEGIGDPSIPSGDAILVENVPGNAGNVSVADIEHAIETTAAAQGIKKTPKPGDPKYEEMKEEAEKFLLEGIWIQGVAAEWGIEATDQEVAKELKKIEKESFKSEAEFKEFLKKSHYTQTDVDNRVRTQILAKKLQEELAEKAPKPTQGEIEDYYEAAKATQFTQKPSREFRVVTNKDKGKVEEAFDELIKDNSAANWAKVAKQYSSDPNTKEKGGLQPEIQEGTIEEPLNAAVFGAPEGRLEGPVKNNFGYSIFEVVKATPESTQELKTVESQIKSTLEQRAQQEYLQAFVSEFSTEWTDRTFCADGYVIERCANYESSGRPANAPPGCYEADPKGGRPEACPAPVFQAVPALPGSITPLEPTGKPLPQRPRQAGEEEGAAAAPEGLPEGAVPPTEAAPEEAPEEAPSE